MRLLLGQNPGPVAHTDPARCLRRLRRICRPACRRSCSNAVRISSRPKQQLMAANAQIGVARAQFFPQISISASAGLGGNEFSNLFDLSGRTIYGIGSLAQPIFAGGKLRGQLQLAEQTRRRWSSIIRRLLPAPSATCQMR